MENPTTRDFAALGDRYSQYAEVVTRQDVTYPVAIERHDGLAVASEVIDMKPPDAGLVAGGDAHLRSQIAANPRMHDGKVLALDSACDGRLVLRPATYFTMVATCDALRAEFERDDTHELRELAESIAAPDPLRLGNGRAAAVGVTIAVTCSDANGRALLIGRRRPDLAADPGKWDVAPSGMVEPAPEGREAVTHSADREVREELGGKLAAADGLVMLGLAFDLLRLKPEVVLGLEIPRCRLAELALSSSEFERTQILDLSAGSLRRFWGAQSPDCFTATGAATVAMLEMRDTHR